MTSDGFKKYSKKKSYGFTLADVVVIALFLFSSVYFFFVTPNFAKVSSANNTYLYVKKGARLPKPGTGGQDNEQRISLNSSVSRTVRMGGEGRCVVQIKGLKVRVKESDCPDKICVKTGWIDKPGQSIICLPHRIYLEIKGGEDLDASIR